MTETVDAVVVGAGPNGMVAAIALADAGWDVLVVEAADEVGGAVRSAQVTAPGFETDLFSAFYPLAAASPVIRGLDLDQHGLTWCRAPSVLAHPFPDGRAAVLRADVQDTAAGLEEAAAGDGQAWLDLAEHWHRVRDPLLDALFTPLPPVAPVIGLARRLGASGMLDLARLATIPARRLVQERFRSEEAGLLITGNALHSDLPPDGAGSGLFGWLLAMLGQDVGFPVPQGGSGRLSLAMRSRAEAAGARFRCGTAVDRVVVANGRVHGVELADGTRVRARKAVVADVSAPMLYGQLVAPDRLPARLLDDLGRFQWDPATLKVNWALERPVPWTAEVHGAGTVHLGVDHDTMVGFSGDLAVGRVPSEPFVLFGQMTTADPTRSPGGTESAWAYTHLPRDVSPQAAAAHVDTLERAVERVAPGFGDAVIARHVQLPADLAAADANLAGGAINGGTAGLHQQLVFRPTPGLGRPETPVAGLYLASASAHPGGGVHGACGWNAARAALGASGPTGALRRALVRTAWARVLQ